MSIAICEGLGKDERDGGEDKASEGSSGEAGTREERKGSKEESSRRHHCRYASFLGSQKPFIEFGFVVRVPSDVFEFHSMFLRLISLYENAAIFAISWPDKEYYY